MDSGQAFAISALHSHSGLVQEKSSAPAPSKRRKQKQKGSNRKPAGDRIVPPNAKLQVSRDEAAQMLSISVRGVDYLISTKKLSTRRIGSRVLIPIEDVRKFARSDHPQRLAG